MSYTIINQITGGHIESHYSAKEAARAVAIMNAHAKKVAKHNAPHTYASMPDTSFIALESLGLPDWAKEVLGL